MSDPAPSTDDIKGLLTDRLEELAEALLGAPNKETRRRSEWRWGAKGSAALVMASRGGKVRGAFFNHENGQGGSPIDLIMYARACQAGEAIGWAKNWLGIAAGEYTPSPASEEALRARQAQRNARTAEAAESEAARIAYAKRLWAESKPIAGTAAAIYLQDTRRIPEPAGGWPDMVRFHPRSCALILLATTVAGEVRGVQRVYLTRDGSKIGPAEIEQRRLPAGKQSSGVFEGAAVRLPGLASGPLQLAEGPETGLSAWVSTRHETLVLLGGFGKAEPQLGRPVVICRDDDKRHSPADNQLRRIVAEWRAKRVDAKVATPWRTRQFDKSDLNDTLQAQGVHGVRRRIDLALNPQATAVERRPIAEVRRLLDAATAKFFEAAAAWVPPSEDAEDGPRHVYPDGGEFTWNSPDAATPAPVHAIKVDVGAGKSRAAYRYALNRLLAMRAAGDTRTIAVAVPTHLLGDQQALTFAAIATESGSNLTALVYRGMEAPDPRHPDFLDDRIFRDQKTRMCQNLDAVLAAREASASVSKSACRQKSVAGIPALGIEPGAFITCPFFGLCGTQAQKSASADLWIVPHELLFLERPAALGNVGMVIVDESCWQDGLEGTSGRPTSIAIEELEKHERIVTPDGMVDHLATDRLAFLRSELVEALKAQTDGSVLRDAMLSGNLTATNVAEAYRLEYRRMVDPGLHPRMTEAERRACVRAAQGNARVLKVARAWKALMALVAADGPEASGWLTLATEHDKEDQPVRVLQIKGRRSVRAGWIAPTLILDATMNVDLVRPYWPQVEVAAELLATAPHQHIRQVIDRAYSKSMLEPLDDEAALADPELARRRERNLRRLHAIIVREARRYAPERVLVVCQKAIKEALHRLGMPNNVELAHHNAVAGRDEWGPQPDRDGVRALIVVGRTMPAVGSVNRLAEALTGVAVNRPEGNWYARGDAVREMADGVAVATEAERHPDPIAEAIRWQICEGEIVQIIGRPRGVNRTSENPVDILLMTDIAVPVPVEQTLSSADLEPSTDDMMLAAGGMAFTNGRHAHAAYPQLWPSWSAARQAILRSTEESRSATSLSEYSLLLEECRTPLARVDYQVAGPGQKPAVAWCDLGMLADPGAFLSAKLGTLAFVRLTPPEHPDPPAHQAGQPLEPAPEPAGGDGVPPSAGQPQSQPPAAVAPLSPAAALPADLDWGRHVWLADSEMPGEWWPGVMSRPAAPFPGPIRVNARAVRPQWDEDGGDDWRRDMLPDDPYPHTPPFAWAPHQPMRTDE
ncbi:MAG: DUF7146 domain-containing protein [Janthinobacterium lividum]